MTVMQKPTDCVSDEWLETLRGRCEGFMPLRARVESWMLETLSTKSRLVRKAVEQFGSPLNLVSTAPFVRNLNELADVAQQHELPFQVFFARKANKCLAFVDAALSHGAGVDVASIQECRQALDRGASGKDLVCTAAIKSNQLVRLCIENEVTIAIDNLDELKLIKNVAASADKQANCALRVSGFHHAGKKLHSRFGFDVDHVESLARSLASDGARRVKITGLHFHLDGYCASERVSAIQQSLALIDALRDHGHEIVFLDIGGGFPMCYLEDQHQWNDFWAAHREALLQRGPSVTYRNHGLGLLNIDGQLHGRRNVYPYWQSPIAAQWLSGILSASTPAGVAVAEAIRRRDLQLRCEPGRSVLDGCGMTVARVEFCKRHHSGDWFIGLAMNSTQCRTNSDDFLVDPLLIPSADRSADRDHVEPVDGYLVGAYCTESELIQLRKLRFPHGVGAGDLIVFPNTAGYLMHFLESRSHQFPLAKNLIVESNRREAYLDSIDGDASVKADDLD